MTTLMPTVEVTAQQRAGLRYIPYLALGIDLTLVSLSVMVAALGRERINLPVQNPDLEITANLGIVGPVIILGWIVSNFLFGAYRAGIFGAGLDEYKRVINASLINAAFIGIACYQLRFPLSRSFFILAFLIGIPLLALGRFALRREMHRARSRGLLQSRVVIAGSEGHVDEIVKVLDRKTWLGYDVIGAVIPEPGTKSSTCLGIPLLGRSGSVAEIAIEAEADIVFLAGGAFDTTDDVRRLVWDLEHEAIQVVIAPSVTDVASERISLRPVGGLPLIHLEQPRSQTAARRAKRLFDIVAALSLLLLSTPLLLLAAFRVWHHDGGPVLTRQMRAGREGKTFGTWSFRTARTDADQVVAGLGLDTADLDDGLFDIENDPRLTGPARWLRRYSVDELPQLLNVIVGDMSMVGPNAPLSRGLGHLLDVDRRLLVRPGLTGVWRDFRRSDLSRSEAETLDVYYVENWSVLQDLTILARTIGSAVRGTSEGSR